MSGELTGPDDTMRVAECYRQDVEYSICRDHYDGRKPMPPGSPSLGRVLDARPHGRCGFCLMAEEQANGAVGK